MSDYKQLYNAVKLQNTILLAQQTQMTNEFSTDTQIIKYKSDDIRYYQFVNYYLRWVYYLVALAIIYIVAFGKNKGFNLNNFILMVFVFAYPFIIIPIEKFVFFLLRYMYALVFRNPYLQFQYDTPSFTLSGS
jgi:uncharacterized membrane protein